MASAIETLGMSLPYRFELYLDFFFSFVTKQ
jgi:hypothetical protein